MRFQGVNSLPYLTLLLSWLSGSNCVDDWPVGSMLARPWHLFNDTQPNDMLDDTHSHIMTALRMRWMLYDGEENSLRDRLESKPYRQLFFEYAMQEIYRHQHPADCSSARFLVSSGYNHGLVHDVHVEGYGLALAMELDRIYIPSRRNSISLEYFPNNRTYFCHDLTSVDCYYDLWTNCTWADLDPIVFRQRNAIRVMRTTLDMDEEFRRTGRISDDLKAKYKDEAVLGVDIHDKDATYRRLVPYQFKHIVERSVIPDTRRYYWWRGISATYLLRPNYYMKIVLDRFSSPTAKMLSGKCVGMFIRQGKDKGGSVFGEEASVVEEGTAHPFREYAQVAGQLWDVTYIDDEATRRGTRTIILGTDTGQVLMDALDWGEKRKWDVLYNPLLIDQLLATGQTVDIKRIDKTSTNSTRKEVPQFMTSKKGLPLLEYASNLLTLIDLLQCDSFVCTLSSNYCRILDEYRAMLAAKPGSFFADLSAESCWDPPCVGPSKFKWMGW